MNSLKEQYLLARIRMFKDEKAFEEIIKSNFPAVRRFLQMKLPTVQDSEDAFTITALRVWNYLCSSKIESVSGLIFTIARGVVAEFYRKQKIETVSYDQYNNEGEKIIDHHGDQGQNAKKIIEQIDQDILREVINLLPDKDANNIRWRYLDELSNKEIAKRLKKTEGATRTAVKRSRQALKKILEEKYDR